MLRQSRKAFLRVWRNLKFILNHPLTQDDKIGAIKRYFLFHIIHHFLPGPALYPFVNDIRIFSQPSQSSSNNIYTGLGEFEEMAFMLHFLRNGDLFVDVGANIGEYTLLSAGICKSNVIAIEPIQSTFHSLKINVQINNLADYVKLFNVGLGSSNSQMFMTATPNSVLNHVLAFNHQQADDNQEDAVKIEIKILDEILGKDIPIMMKVDVEGYESEILKGGVRTLRNQDLKALLIELNGNGSRYGVRNEDIHQILVKNGFAPYSYSPFGRQISPLREFNRFKPNTIYIRDIAFVDSRIKLGPEITDYAPYFL